MKSNLFINVLFSKYLMCIILSLITNIIISIIRLKKTYKLKDILICMFFENIGIILGAKLLDILVNIDNYIYHITYSGNLTILLISGYMFLGAIIGAIFAIYIYSIIYNKSFVELINILFPNLILIYAISKIGCYFNGCCEGILLTNGKCIPIQLIESAIYFFIYLFSLVKKEDNTYKYNLAILFFIARFILEFFRKSNSVMYISISQVFLIIIIVLLITCKKYIFARYNSLNY